MTDKTTMDAVLAKIRAMPKPPGNVFYLSPESDEEREALRALRERGLAGRRGDVRYPNVLGDRESLYGITEDMPDPEDMDAFREMALGWVEGDKRFDDGNLDPDYVEVWWYWWLTADGVAQLWAPFQPKTERRFPLRDEIDSLRADNARLRDELAEARATLAAERGEAEGAPSEGWEHEFAYEGEHTWRKVAGGSVAVISGIHGANTWEVMPLDEDGDVDWNRSDGFHEGAIPSGTFREGMRLADAALATMEPPDAD